MWQTDAEHKNPFPGTYDRPTDQKNFIYCVGALTGFVSNKFCEFIPDFVSEADEILLHLG